LPGLFWPGIFLFNELRSTACEKRDLGTRRACTWVLLRSQWVMFRPSVNDARSASSWVKQGALISAFSGAVCERNITLACAKPAHDRLLCRHPVKPNWQIAPDQRGKMTPEGDAGNEAANRDMAQPGCPVKGDIRIAKEISATFAEWPLLHHLISYIKGLQAALKFLPRANLLCPANLALHRYCQVWQVCHSAVFQI
jgi:hypothetical protein